jgi:hypothetical protein
MKLARQIMSMTSKRSTRVQTRRQIEQYKPGSGRRETIKVTIRNRENDDPLSEQMLRSWSTVTELAGLSSGIEKIFVMSAGDFNGGGRGKIDTPLSRDRLFRVRLEITTQYAAERHDGDGRLASRLDSRPNTLFRLPFHPLAQEGCPMRPIHDETDLHAAPTFLAFESICAHSDLFNRVIEQVTGAKGKKCSPNHM